MLAPALAWEEIRLISASLVRAFKKGNDIKARGDMIIASCLGALSFLKGLGAAHSLAYGLFTQVDIPHGAAYGIHASPCDEVQNVGKPGKGTGCSKIR